MPVTESPTTPDCWNTTTEQTPIGVKVTANRPDSPAWYVVKEYPNGAELSHRHEADLPGGFKILDRESFEEAEQAIAELERKTTTDSSR